MNQNENQMQCVQDDEIDLRELWKTLMQRKMLIVSVTLAFTLAAVAFALLKTPVYEISASLKLGHQQKVDAQGVPFEDYFLNNNELLTILERKFEIEENLSVIDEPILEAKLIKDSKGLISLSVQAIDNQTARTKLREVVDFVVESEKLYFDNIYLNIEEQIRKQEVALKFVNDFSIPNLDRDRKMLLKKRLPNVEKEKSALEHELELNTLEVRRLEHSITKLEKNIERSQNELKSVLEDDKTLSSVVLMDILGNENKLYNLNTKVNELKKKNNHLTEVSIPAVILKETTMKTVELDKIEQEIKRQKIDIKPKLEQEIVRLKRSLTPPMLTQAYVLGGIKESLYPVKPKKKLIVAVAFVGGLMFSIFLVFFLEFIKGTKEEIGELH